MISSPSNPSEETDTEDPASKNAGRDEEARSSGGLSKRFRKSWERFAASRPGRRFQDRYAHRKSLRRRRERKLIRSSWLRKFDLARFMYLGGGLLLILLSAVGGWLPVLGWGTFFLGLGLIAGEFRPAARLMDWGEKRGRKAFRPVWRFFLTLPRWLQVIIPVLIALGTFALVAKVFQVTFLGG